MRNIPPNVWRTGLKDSDWNFARCPSDELQACLWWELHRERAQAEAGGSFPANRLKTLPEDIDYRALAVWRLLYEANPKRVVPKKFRQLLKEPKGWTFNPDFPQLPYLERGIKERRKSIRRELCSGSGWLEPGTKGWDELRHAIEDGQNVIWADGVEIVPLVIPWAWRDEDIIEAFTDWLKEHRPTGEAWDDRPRVDEPPPRPKDKGGAGSPIRQAKAGLKALGGWRLIQYYNGNVGRACNHPGAAEYLGKQFIHRKKDENKPMPGAWSEARARVRKMLPAKIVEIFPLRAGARS